MKQKGTLNDPQSTCGACGVRIFGGMGWVGAGSQPAPPPPPNLLFS